MTLNIFNNNGNGYTGISFGSTQGYVPPDPTGAAGPLSYVQTVNQSLALYPTKLTGVAPISSTLSNFFFTTGKLTRADSSSGLSDPITCYDEKIGRYIIGDQDVNFTSHVSTFDIAVSKTNNPTSLSASDWNFYKINTTQANQDADYPGNFGYNADSFVFTLNEFPVSGTTGTYHTQVVSLNTTDLANGIATPGVYQSNLADFCVRPTTMHDSVAGDPMWLTTEHGDNKSIDVIKMTNVLSTAPAFNYTNVAVTPYLAPVSTLNPNGTVITSNIDSRIDKSAEANNHIVSVHSVGKSATQDVVQWYDINVSSGTPTLAQQGRIDAGNNTYLVDPGIDINPNGDIGISYIQSGNDTSTDYMSTWVTGRIAQDPIGTMQTPIKVPNGSGQANYTDFANPHREGDLSGINVDPVDGSFWATNEFANTQATANWGTVIVNFKPSAPVNPADLSVTNSGPSSITAGTNATYNITISNNGPNAANRFVLKDILPTGATLVSMTQTSGSDGFTFAQSGNTITESASSALNSGSSDTFTLVVSAPTTLVAGSAFSDSAQVSSDNSTTDPVLTNNSSTVTGSIVGAPADLAVTNLSSVSSANEGDNIVYTVTVTNNGPNPGTGVVLTDTLGANLSYISATATQGTFTSTNGVSTFTIGTINSGATVTLKVTAKALEEGTVSNISSVAATSADTNTANNSSTATTLVNEPPIVVTAKAITIKTGSNVNYSLATFTHAAGIELANAFKATINWGDGTSSTGVITLSGTTYSVTGTHKYAKTGYTPTVTVAEVGQSAQLLLAKAGDEVPALPERIRYMHVISTKHRGVWDSSSKTIEDWFGRKFY